MIRILPAASKLTTLCLSVLISLLAGACRIAPDLTPSPDLGPVPEIDKDARVSDVPAIPSILIEQAVSDPRQPRVALLEIGDDALLARIHLIRAARQSIDLQTFIYQYDETGSWVYKELLEAARRGVKVRLLIDHVLSPRITPSEYAALAAAHANIEIRLFRPISKNALVDSVGTAQSALFRFNTLNYRMHNKVMLIDNAVAIVGGRNIQNAYFDRDSGLCFRDRDVMVSGPVLDAISHSFSTFWNHPDSVDALRMADVRKALVPDNLVLPKRVTGAIPGIFTELDELANHPDISVNRPDLRFLKVREIGFIADQPIKETRFGKSNRINPFAQIYSLFEASEADILIQTPYAVIDNRTYKELRKIRKRNPEVRVRLSTNSLSSADHAVVGGVALKQRRFQVEGLGIELYLAKPVPGDIAEFVPRHNLLAQAAAAQTEDDWLTGQNRLLDSGKATRYCIHAKSMVVDRKVSMVGSHNFDPRSVYLNSECMVVIKDAVFAERLAHKIEKAMHPHNSWVVARRGLPTVVGELNSLITLVSSNLPMFDLWPLEQVSCFDLKEGFDPLSPYHEDFHDHYQDVGPIPGLDIGIEQVKVQLIRAFAGETAPLL